MAHGPVSPRELTERINDEARERRHPILHRIRQGISAEQEGTEKCIILNRLERDYDNMCQAVDELGPRWATRAKRRINAELTGLGY